MLSIIYVGCIKIINKFCTLCTGSLVGYPLIGDDLHSAEIGHNSVCTVHKLLMWCSASVYQWT